MDIVCSVSLYHNAQPNARDVRGDKMSSLLSTFYDKGVSLSPRCTCVSFAVIKSVCLASLQGPELSPPGAGLLNFARGTGTSKV